MASYNDMQNRGRIYNFGICCRARLVHAIHQNPELWILLEKQNGMHGMIWEILLRFVFFAVSDESCFCMFSKG